MKIVYIYALIHPISKEIRYIGKTLNLKQRLMSHKSSFKKTTHVSNWISSLLKQNLSPEMIIIETCDESNWEKREKHWIAYYRERVKLCNITDGGEVGIGLILSEEEIANRKVQLREVSRLLKLGYTQTEAAKTVGVSSALITNARQNKLQYLKNSLNIPIPTNKDYINKLSGCQKGMISKNKNKGKGYYFNRGKWVVYSYNNGKRKSLGRYNTEQEAIIVRTDYINSIPD